MASDNDNEVRINVTVYRERNDLLNKLLPWGAKSAILRNLVEQLIDKLESDESGEFYSALVKNQISLEHKQ